MSGTAFSTGSGTSLSALLRFGFASGTMCGTGLSPIPVLYQLPSGTGFGTASGAAPEPGLGLVLGLVQCPKGSGLLIFRTASMSINDKLRKPKRQSDSEESWYRGHKISGFICL